MITFSKVLGSLFGIGFSRFAPGTLGSLFACFTFIFCFSFLTPTSFFLIISVISVLGIWLGSVAEKSHQHDPQWFVLDEWVGQSIPLIFVSGNDYLMISISFVLFRFFDISKILFINQIQNLNGGMGIMMDDIFAGIYSLIIIWGIQWFMN